MHGSAHAVHSGAAHTAHECLLYPGQHSSPQRVPQTSSPWVSHMLQLRSGWQSAVVTKGARE
jgi:hypothetical protein